MKCCKQVEDVLVCFDQKGSRFSVGTDQRRHKMNNIMSHSSCMTLLTHQYNPVLIVSSVSFQDLSRILEYFYLFAKFLSLNLVL